MPGKTIKLFLVDGVPSGLLTAEIMNWSGKVVVVPRAQLALLAGREESKRTGVYLLIGPDPDSPSKFRVYIGESDNCFTRLVSHGKDPVNDFCTRVVLVTSKDPNVTKAHVRYLENKLILQAKASGRAKIANDTNGSPVALPESDIADMDAFFENVQMILPVLGFDFTQPKMDVSAVASEATGSISPLFTLNVVGASGRAREVNGEFVLLKGSTARRQGVPSWTSYKSLRDELVRDSKFKDEGVGSANYVAVEDIVCWSPSAAAAFVAGRNMNGPQMWKVEGTGESYQEWRDRKLPG